MSNIDDTLAERGSRYGDFEGHATVTQTLKEAMQAGDNWDVLPDNMKEALEMVAHKIGRILNGDPNYVDSWTDIIGYVRLVEKQLLGEQATPELEKTATSPAEVIQALAVLIKAGVIVNTDDEQTT